MRVIFTYIKEYFYLADRRLLAIVTLLTAFLVFLNYYYCIDERIGNLPTLGGRFTGRYFIYLIAFALPYAALLLLRINTVQATAPFFALLLIAPAIFSLKAGLAISFDISAHPFYNEYWNAVLYWPLLLAMMTAMLFLCWKFLDRSQHFYGMGGKRQNWRPYVLMLLCMVPLIAAASAQQDFREVYPKLRAVMDLSGEHELTAWQQVLFELSYGSDFVGIELFFRGFLVLAFLRWAGLHAILPMACFYCCIHFGKPVGECISSYFGGLLLGIVLYNTRSIWGGLMVHLGIAWLMELGGWIAMELE